MHRRFPIRQWLIITLLCLGPLLIACGQKGALYLPDEPAPAPKQQPADEQDEKKS